MRESRWSRPMFGPFRRRAKTGVPADHFPPARLMFDHGDGERVLVADGPGTDVLEPDALELVEWWFPSSEARQAFIDGTEEWASSAPDLTGDVRERLQAEALQHGGSLEPIEGGVTAKIATPAGSPTLALFVLPDDSEEAELRQRAEDAAARSRLSSGVVASAMSRLTLAERRRVDGENEIVHAAGCMPESCVEGCPLAALVASAFVAAGGSDAWAARREAAGLTAAADAEGNIVGAPWHAYLCAEGVRTDDGRELVEGACRFPDLPVSIRLLIEDEGGHWGAVTCGRIDLMDRRPLGALQMIYSEGVFGSDPNGQLAELMVEEQTQRFVSIDPRDATGEYIEVEIRRSGSDDEVMYDCWMRILDCVIGAATIVAMPALPQAVITLAGVSLPEAPIANATAPPGLGELDPVVAEVEAVAASAAPEARPHREWFDDPGFHIGDPRLVLQSDNKSYACPLTVCEPDPVTGMRRVYGHVAWWNCDHTAFPGKRVKPPKSMSGYAEFLTGQAVRCADGSSVNNVGQITMGCGHAPTFHVVGDRKLAVGAAEAKAHYDGGYGAIQVCDVRAGQDDFGPWVAGWVRSTVTDQQLADFMALNLSGDWRDIAGALDMVAVLAVPVPGFPVRRAISASGAPELDGADTIAGYIGDRVVSLVAAGVVRRQTAEERFAHLEQELGSALGRLEQLEGKARERALAVARARHGL